MLFKPPLRRTARTRGACTSWILALSVALVCGGCHLIFPFEQASPNDAEASVSSDGPASGDLVQDLGLDRPGSDLDDAAAADAAAPDLGPASDAPVQDATAPDSPASDAAPVADQALPPDAPPADSAPWPDLVPSADAPPPPTGVVMAESYGYYGTDRGNAVALDSAGNIYVTGAFSDTIYLGGGWLLTSNGAEDIFVASFDPNGGVRWAKGFGGAGGEQGWAVAVDSNGNVAITGDFTSSSVDFKNGQVVSNTNTGPTDVFVASLDAVGTCRWARSFGDPQGTDDHGYGIATGPAGEVTITGEVVGDPSFGGSCSLPKGNSRDVFLVQYDDAGSCTWARRIESWSNVGTGWALASNGSGTLFVGGSFDGNTDFGGQQPVSINYKDAFVASYYANGTLRWVQSLGGVGQDEGLGVAVTAAGNVVLTGYFEGPVSQPPGVGLVSAGGTDGVLASFDAASGSFQWARRFGGPGSDLGRAVALDTSGTAYVTGHFSGTADYDGLPLFSAGDADILVAKTSVAGAPLWAKRIGGPLADQGHGVAVGANALVVTGYFQDTVDFGVTLRSSAGDTDIFWARLTP